MHSQWKFWFKSINNIENFEKGDAIEETILQLLKMTKAKSTQKILKIGSHNKLEKNIFEWRANAFKAFKKRENLKCENSHYTKKLLVFHIIFKTH